MITKETIPSSWVETTLGEVFTPDRPRHSPVDFPELPFVGMEHVEAHTMRLLSTAPTSTVRSSAVHFWPGDVLYGRLRPYLNKVLVSGFEGLGSAEFIVFPSHPNIESGYLAYFLNSSAFVSFATHLNEGDRPRVNFDQIASYRFPLPPLAEQRRIVAEIETQLTRLDAAMAALKRSQANLKRYRASVLKAAVEGRLVDIRSDGSLHLQSERTDFQILEDMANGHAGKRAGRLWGAGVVPVLTSEEHLSLSSGWTWKKVQDLGTSIDDVVQVGPMSMQSNSFTDEGVPVLNVGAVKWGKFDESKINFIAEDTARKFERYRLLPGDVMFTRSGTVGRCAVVQEHQSRWLMTFHLLRVRVNPNKCDPKYLQMVFEGASHIRRQTRDASIGSTRAGFNTRLLAELDIPVPPRHEQHRIVEEVERRLSVVEAMEKSVVSGLARGERMRQAILRKAFAGELVPQDPNDEPASTLLKRIRAERIAVSPPKGLRKHRPAVTQLELVDQ